MVKRLPVSREPIVVLCRRTRIAARGPVSAILVAHYRFSSHTPSGNIVRLVAGIYEKRTADAAAGLLRRGAVARAASGRGMADGIRSISLGQTMRMLPIVTSSFFSCTLGCLIVCLFSSPLPLNMTARQRQTRATLRTR